MYDVRRAKREKKVLFYQCNTSPAVPPYDPNCRHPAVRTERLESFVLATIRERLLEAGAAQVTLTRFRVDQHILCPLPAQAS